MVPVYVSVWILVDLFRMSEEQVQRFRLMRLFAVSRLPKHHFYVRADRAAPVWVDPRDDEEDGGKNSEQDDDDTDTSDNEEEEWEGEDTAVTQSEMVHDSIVSSSTAAGAGAAGGAAEKTLVYAKRPKLVIVRMRSGKRIVSFRSPPPAVFRYAHAPPQWLSVLFHVYRPGYGHVPRSLSRFPRSLHRTSNAGHGACLAVGYWYHLQV